MQDLTNTTDQLGSFVYYSFTPLLVLIILLTVFSNTVNIVMIVKYFQKSTSLNIAFLNISVFNILLVFNQAVLLALILLRGQPIHAQFCHLAMMCNTISDLGTGFVHLFLAWDRYKIALKPNAWLRNRKIAWLYTTGLWLGISMLAIYNLIFYYEDIHGDVSSCFVVTYLPFHSAYGTALQFSYLIVFIGLSIPIYVFHTKTASILKEKAKENHVELKKTSSVKIGRLRRSGPQRAVNIILTIYTLHFVTQVPFYLYNVLDQILSPNSHVPLLSIITITISFGTATSPLFMFLNNRYKRNIYYFLRWIGIKPKEKSRQTRHLLNLNSEPKKFPDNKEIFYSKSKPNNSAIEYSARPDSPSKRTRQLSGGSVSIEEKKKAAIKSAVESGLVLSAAGHPIQINNFFKDDHETWIREMYGFI